MDFSSKRLIQILELNGYLLKRTKGSHYIYYNPENNITVPIPVHRKDVKKGTFYSILKEVKIDKNKLG